MDDTFIKKGKYLWSKRVMETFLSELKEIQTQNPKRCLTEFILELESANNTFLQEIKDLPLIINCRAKINNENYFGGLQCADFMKRIVKACDKYLKSCENSENTISPIISQVKNKAKRDETLALDFEKETKENYTFLGVDNSRKIFESSGYTFE